MAQTKSDRFNRITNLRNDLSFSILISFFIILLFVHFIWIAVTLDLDVLESLMGLLCVAYLLYCLLNYLGGQKYEP
jgi:Flp pilus assembly protein protease CpaA